MQQSEFPSLEEMSADQLDEYIRMLRSSRVMAPKVARTPKGKPKESKVVTRTSEDPAKLAAMLDITLEEAQAIIAERTAQLELQLDAEEADE